MALNDASELGFLAKFLAEFVSRRTLVSSVRPFQVLRTQVSTRTKWWEKRPELGVGFGVGISASSTGNKTNSAISPSFLMDHLYLKHFIKIFTRKFEIFFLYFVFLVLSYSVSVSVLKLTDEICKAGKCVDEFTVYLTPFPRSTIYCSIIVQYKSCTAPRLALLMSQTKEEEIPSWAFIHIYALWNKVLTHQDPDCHIKRNFMLRNQ